MGNTQIKRSLNTTGYIDFGNLKEKDFFGKPALYAEVINEVGDKSEVRLTIEKNGKPVNATLEDVEVMRNAFAEDGLKRGGALKDSLKKEVEALNATSIASVKELKIEKIELKDKKKEKTITDEEKDRLDELDDLIDNLEGSLIDVDSYIEENLEKRKEERIEFGRNRKTFHITGMLLDKNGNASLEINSPDKKVRNLKFAPIDDLIVNISIEKKDRSGYLKLNEDYKPFDNNVVTSISPLTSEIALKRAFDKIREVITAVESGKIQEFNHLLIPSVKENVPVTIKGFVEEINAIRESKGYVRDGDAKFTDEEIGALRKGFHKIEEYIMKTGFINSEVNLDVNMFTKSFDVILNTLKNDLLVAVEAVTKTTELSNQELDVIENDIEIKNIAAELKIPFNIPGAKIQYTYYCYDSNLGPKLGSIQAANKNGYGGFGSSDFNKQVKDLAMTVGDVTFATPKVEEKETENELTR